MSITQPRDTGAFFGTQGTLEAKQRVADVLLYLIRISDKLGIDLIAAANAKIKLNAAKYPAQQVEKARGSSKKYTALGLNFPAPWNNGSWNLITTQSRPR